MEHVAQEPKRLPGAKYWRRLSTTLHVSDAAYLERALQPAAGLDATLVDRCKAQLLADGVKEASVCSAHAGPMGESPPGRGAQRFRCSIQPLLVEVLLAKSLSIVLQSADPPFADQGLLRAVLRRFRRAGPAAAGVWPGPCRLAASARP